MDQMYPNSNRNYLIIFFSKSHDDGEYLYRGIKENLRRCENPIQLNNHIIEVGINVDALPLLKLSRTSIRPILGPYVI